MIFKKKSNIKCASAYLYPDKIIIETMYRRDEFTKYGANIFSTLSIDILDEQLGEKIIEHLLQSKQQTATPEEIKELFKNFKLKAKFKTDKAYIDNAKLVSISFENNQFLFEPKRNKQSEKVFYGMPNEKFEANYSDTLNLGKLTRIAWSKCTVDK
jgi:hypothetical protein